MGWPRGVMLKIQFYSAVTCFVLSLFAWSTGLSRNRTYTIWVSMPVTLWVMVSSLVVILSYRRKPSAPPEATPEPEAVPLVVEFQTTQYTTQRIELQTTQHLLETLLREDVRFIAFQNARPPAGGIPAHLKRKGLNLSKYDNDPDHFRCGL